jgi:hypothetical protein
MPVLRSGPRKQLESGVLAARRAAELGARSAIENLGVYSDRKPDHVTGDAASLRNGLRAKWRQLGLVNESLVAECAFEQWHRLLFARFLAENGLLLHPDLNIPVSLEECDELASELGEPDGWSVAARFASQILPGIFRLDDPCVRIRLAPEHRIALEELLAGLPAEVFTADDSLGWVYQYWQKDSKDEVNASERKVGGADLGPVTQLFTENYMVRFLLENSLGAWWAARHPDSPLLKSWEYLRFNDDGTPAAGSFDAWPVHVAEVTVMDPCCGSGHFLVDAFGMLWRMRAEEQGLSPVEAQDAVLRDNLFGLELDPRCVQIAMFAVAFQAWKDGGGWRQLPVPNIACSGIPVKTPLKEWTDLAKGDGRLEGALAKLYRLFRDADTLGSLIDPRRAIEGGRQLSTEDADWTEVLPLVEGARSRGESDPSSAVLGADVFSIARAASLLSQRYALVVTNVPYLGLQAADERLVNYCQREYPLAAHDLATVFMERAREMSSDGSLAAVSQLTWAFLARFSPFRKHLLARTDVLAFAILGAGAFSAITGEVVQALLTIFGTKAGSRSPLAVDVRQTRGTEGKASGLRSSALISVQSDFFSANPDSLLSLSSHASAPLSAVAESWQGLVTSDVAQYVIKFWEVASATDDVWEKYLTAPEVTSLWAGRSSLLRWEKGNGRLVAEGRAHNFNPTSVLGRRGVLVGQGSLRVALYNGEMFNDASSPVVPRSDDDVAAVWAYLSSAEYAENVRLINHKIVVGSGYLVRVPFDVDYWRGVAAERFPDGLPEPWSDDPTQWLFEGRPEISTAPLQVAVGRLLGFRWPEQSDTDGLEQFADTDGIVCLPSVAGEPPAAEQLAELLAAAYGATWNAGTLSKLLMEAGSKKRSLADWLRDEFFKQHCALFGNRPFVWHIWDGHPQGFSGLVNYHRLDRKTLEKLTYTYLGTDWIERQRAAVRDEEPGAEARLSAAEDLKKKLELILEGEKPYDIYVRWKPLEEQPLGWDPDLDDGVRLNIRPFVEAGVLRSSFNIHWKKDRGTNPDGSERLNDIHLTLAEKQQARKKGR